MVCIIMASAIISCTIGGILYLTTSISRFSLIKSRMQAFLIISILFALFTIILSVLDALVITVYTTLFFIFFRFIEKCLGHYFNIRFKCHLSSWIAIVTSIIFLGSGYYLCTTVVEKDYNLTTEKPVGNLKIALISDSHIGATFDGEGFAKHIKTISEQNPDMLIIAGDFVDDSTTKKDLEIACKSLGELNLKYGVWYCYGNHDKGYFNFRDFTADDLANELTKNNINILEDDYKLIDNKFYIVGRADCQTSVNRMEMDQLLNGVDPNKYVIVMDHEPCDFEAQSKTCADIVLSGHTHGGQMLPMNQLSFIFGHDDRIYGYEKRNNTDFIVTSGISDWGISFKTGTRSEYVIVNISGT